MGVGTMANFGTFSAQMYCNVFISILISPYHNHYRTIIIIVLSNGVILFHILSVNLNSILMTKVAFIRFY